MHLIDYFLIVILTLIIIGAFRLSRKGRSCCGGSCGGCQENCTANCNCKKT